MKKYLLLLIKLLLISIAICSIGIVVSIWLIAREPIPSEVYVKYGIIGAVVGLSEVLGFGYNSIYKCEDTIVNSCC